MIKIQKPKQFLNTKEESKEEEKKSDINDESANIFSDDNITVIPVELISSDTFESGCRSFICLPKQNRGKFIP